jgi:sulfate adenylyltransferase
MIPAHGGRLINRLATGAERDALLARAKAAPRLKLNARETSDFEMIAVGAQEPAGRLHGQRGPQGVS